MPQVENMLPETCEWIFEKRLREAGRTVTEEQWKKVSQGLHESPYPLYVEVRVEDDWTIMLSLSLLQILQ